MPDDTLATVGVIAADPLFAERLRAAAAKESAPGDPAGWVFDNRYVLAAAPGWAADVDYWLAANPSKTTGWQNDQAVISDGEILAQVQHMLKPPDVLNPLAKE